MKRILIKIGTAILNFIYSLMKLGRVKNRVVFISRQENRPSLDTTMLADELNRRGIETVFLCRTMDKGMAQTIKYSFHMLTQMKYMATSKVVVLDSYCIVASLLHHRDDLTIIQMWHALGAMKKFGKSILDMPEGRSSETAELMRMHKGYDYVFTSSEKSRPAFAEAFGYKPEELTVMSLPRVDALLDAELDLKNRKRICADYPVLSDGRKNIVYAPTHRMGEDMSGPIGDLINAVDKTKFNLIIKVHPITEVELGEGDSNVIVDRKYQTIEMLSVADCVITDYSAIAYEVAIKGIPMFFYAYDKEAYLGGRTFYLDYDKDMPGPIFETAEAVMSAVEHGQTDEYRAREQQFSNEYIEKQHGCTDEIADLIESLL